MPDAAMMGAALTVSALQSSKVRLTTTGEAGFAGAGVTAATNDWGLCIPVGVGVGVGVGVAVGSGVVVGAGVVAGSGVVVGAGVVAGSGDGVVVAVGSGVTTGSGLVVGSGAVTGVTGAVEGAGSGAVVELSVGVAGVLAAGVLSGAGVPGSSASAGPASVSVTDTARIAAADAIFISWRRRLFGVDPGVLFTGVPLVVHTSPRPRRGRVPRTRRTLIGGGS
jgi:hypothetical protein